MSDTVEFSVDFYTSVEKIGQLKDKIQKWVRIIFFIVIVFFFCFPFLICFCLFRYIENNPQLWHPNHSVVVLEIENVNKLKMALYVNHTITFQEYGERNRRRTELVMEVKRIFEELSIKYYLLPQIVHLHHIGPEPTLVQKWCPTMKRFKSRLVVRAFPLGLRHQTKKYLRILLGSLFCNLDNIFMILSSVMVRSVSNHF